MSLFSVVFITLDTKNSTEAGEDFGLFSPKSAKKALTAVSEKASRCDTCGCSHKTGSVTQSAIYSHTNYFI